MPEMVMLGGHHIGYQFAQKSMGERRMKRAVYDKATRPYCLFLRWRVYLRLGSGSSHIFEKTRDQAERESDA